MNYTNGIGHSESGKWRVARRGPGGKVFKGTFLTKSEAVRFRNKIDEAKIRARYGTQLADDAPRTIAEAMDEYILDAEARGLADVSIRSLEAAKVAILRHLDPDLPVSLTRRDIMRFVRGRRGDGAGSFTIEKNLKTLHTMIRHTAGLAALTWETPRLVDPQEEAPKPVPSDEEIAATLNALSGRPDVQRTILLALLTALRPGDVFRLDSSDIVDGVIVAGMQKRRGRPIAVPLVQTLSDALEGVQGPLAVTSNAATNALKRTTRKLVEAGLVTTRWHGLQNLRRVAATWSSMAGYHAGDVDVLLGHETWSLARRSYIRHRRNILADPYIDLRREMLQAVESRLLAALDSGNNR